MASSNPDSPPPSLEELSFRGATALLLPLILSMNSPREVAVIIHPSSRSVTLVEGAVDETLLREFSIKQGPSPATKASIEALPRVPVPEPGQECPICLVEYEVNAEVKQMPCGHRFHGGCVDRWLGIHGSCPICRFGMPPDEMVGNYESDGVRISVIILQGPDEPGLGQSESGTDLDAGQGMDVEDGGGGGGGGGNDDVAVEDMMLDNID